MPQGSSSRLHGEHLGLDSHVNLQHRGQRLPLAAAGDLMAQGLGKGGNVFLPHGKACGQGVTAEIFQKASAGGEQLKEIDAAPGTAGTLTHSLVQADHEAGTGIFFRQTGGHNAHHALMPLGSGQYDGPLLRGRGEMADALMKNLALQSLAFPVELTQFRRQLVCPHRVLGEKQLNGYLGPAQAAGGVQPGGQGIAHGDGGDGLVSQPHTPQKACQAETLWRI